VLLLKSRSQIQSCRIPRKGGRICPLLKINVPIRPSATHHQSRSFAVDEGVAERQLAQKTRFHNPFLQQTRPVSASVTVVLIRRLPSKKFLLQLLQLCKRSASLADSLPARYGDCRLHTSYFRRRPIPTCRAVDSIPTQSFSEAKT